MVNIIFVSYAYFVTASIISKQFFSEALDKKYCTVFFMYDDFI